MKRRILFLPLCLALGSCQSGGSSSPWYQSVGSYASFSLSEESQPYSPEAIDYGDGFYSGGSRPDQLGLIGKPGDLYLSSHGGSAFVYIGEEGLSEGKVTPSLQGGYFDGWYLVFDSSSGRYCLRDFATPGIGHDLQSAFYRSVFAPNAHLETFADYSGEFSGFVQGRYDVCLGAYAGVETSSQDVQGTIETTRIYSWVEEGLPHTVAEEKIIDQECEDPAMRWLWNWTFRSLAHNASFVGPLLDCFSLFSKNDGVYRLGLKQQTKDFFGVVTDATYVYEIALTEDCRYLKSLKSHAEWESEDGAFSSQNHELFFSGFGVTEVVIPEEIRKAVKGL